VATALLAVLASCSPSRPAGDPATEPSAGAQDGAPRGSALALRTPFEPSSPGVEPGPGPVASAAPQGASPQEIQESRTNAIVRAAQRVSPAVVTIHTLARQRVQPRSLFESFFLPPDAYRSAAGLGSGFIINPSGTVLTNEHVVRGAEEIRVTLPDGRDFPGELVGADPLTDVAVVQIEGEGLPFAPGYVTGTSGG
jgi:S1-C subfamily serine protease